MASKEKLESMLDNLTTLYSETYLRFIHQYGPIDLGKLRVSKNIVVKTYNPTYTNIRILSDILNRKPQIKTEGYYCIAKGIEHYSEEGRRYTDVSTLCLQIEKSKALDYVSLLEDYFTGYYLDQITMECGAELVYDSTNPSFSKASKASSFIVIIIIIIFILY